MVLAGDIGGTKTSLALFDPRADAAVPQSEETYVSSEYSGIEPVLDAFLGSAQCPIEAACLAVAGPVTGGRVQITNLPWEIDVEAIDRRLGFRGTSLINDVQAIAHGIPALGAADLLMLHPGAARPRGTVAVVAPGTGLGMAFAVESDGAHRAYPSEGGHASFAPVTPLQDRLLMSLRPRWGRVSVERVASGSGLPDVYAFLRDEEGYSEPAWLRDAIAESDDPAPTIAAHALDGSSDLCSATLELFAAILGTAAGDFALRVLATGGIYLAGGIPPKILPILRSGPFLQALHAKGRFRTLLERIPVHVVLSPRAALLGAARWASPAPRSR
jgi:glucokinase